MFSRRTAKFLVLHEFSMVLDLVAWERIHVVDLQRMPAVKQLFMEVTQAAHHSYWDKGHRDSETDRGNPGRKFAEISEAKLAANILPRLEHIRIAGASAMTISNANPPNANTPRRRLSS